MVPRNAGGMPGRLAPVPHPRLPGGSEHRLWQAGPGQRREKWSGPERSWGWRALARACECVCISPHGTISKESAWIDRAVSLTPFNLSYDWAIAPWTPLSLLDRRELVLSLSRASGSSFKMELAEVRVYVSPSYWEFLKDRGRGTSSPRPRWVGRGRETERRGLHPHSFRSKTNCPQTCLQSGGPVGASRVPWPPALFKLS